MSFNSFQRLSVALNGSYMPFYKVYTNSNLPSDLRVKELKVRLVIKLGKHFYSYTIEHGTGYR